MYGWIDATQFSFNTLLLMDRWIFNAISQNKHAEFVKNLGIALSGNPAVYWYIVNKCPEQEEYYRKVTEGLPRYSKDEVRNAEVYVLDVLDGFVVYVFPELTENLPYVKDWDPVRLLELTDFKNKTVLDIGTGTGRLAFAAAPLAKYIYASEPADRMREFMREKAKALKIDNVYVIDGTAENLAFPDESFDIVMSGHVIGDDYDAELLEIERVTKPGGWIIDCPGEEHRKKSIDNELVRRGFEHSHYVSKTGGDVYRYCKQKPEH